MRFEKEAYAVAPNETIQPHIFLTFEGSSEPLLYDNALNPLGVTWNSSDRTVATVSAQGVVTCLKYGTVVITAQTAQFATPITTQVVSVDPLRALWWGEWVVTTWNGDSALANKIYIALNDDATFDLYQNVESQGYASFKGTYVVDESEDGYVLSGSYNDGVALSQAYDLSVELAKLTLKGRGDKVVAVYAKTTIPDYVKDGVSAQASRAVSGKRFL